ncbi:MAG TPA: electron transfer flavoprotein subunit beta/FixA family protein [Candidatus Baltobacteraceae bacterium]
MKIVATVKLVPDPNSEKRIDPQTKRLDRSGAETVLNPYDEYAVEAALQLKEKLGDGTTVTVFSMAPERHKEILRKALAMGADDAVVLSDPALAGSDVWSTAAAIAAGLKKIGFDLVVCGGLSDDGSTGGTPGALAEHLGVPGLTNARHLECDGQRLTAQRETDSGYQVVATALPALVSVTMAVGEPRYASLKGIMGAKKKTLATLCLADLGSDVPAGDDGALTELVRVGPPATREKAAVVNATDGASGARAIFDFLKQRKLV